MLAVILVVQSVIIVGLLMLHFGPSPPPPARVVHHTNFIGALSETQKNLEKAREHGNEVFNKMVAVMQRNKKRDRVLVDSLLKENQELRDEIERLRSERRNRTSSMNSRD